MDNVSRKRIGLGKVLVLERYICGHIGNTATLLYDVNDAITSFCLLHDLNPSINTYYVKRRDQINLSLCFSSSTYPE